MILELNENSVSGQEIFELWQQFGTLRRVENYLRIRGVISSHHKPYTQYGLWWRMYAWIVYNPEISRKYFVHVPEPIWRKFLVRRAAYIYKYGQSGFKEWIAKHPWAIEPQYRRFWRHYYSPEEINAIKQSGQTEISVS